MVTRSPGPIDNFMLLNNPTWEATQMQYMHVHVCVWGGGGGGGSQKVKKSPHELTATMPHKHNCW